MYAMAGPAWLVLSLIQLSGLCAQNIASTPPTRECPTQFSLQRSYYRSCVNTGTSHFNYPERITGAALLEGLETFCRGIAGYKLCGESLYTGCQADLVSLIDTLWARSTWMCDNNGQVRSVVAEALSSSTADSVTSAETNFHNCADTQTQWNCFRTTYNKFTSLEFMQQGSISMPVAEVFENPASTRFFYEFFDCAYQDVKERCPHNALAMTLTEHSHFLFPPKFGINISDIILQTAGQNNA